MVAAAAEDGGAELPAAPVTLRVREGSPVTLSVQQLQGLPWPDLARIWKEYVNASAMCLVTAGPAGEARLAVRAPHAPHIPPSSILIMYFSLRFSGTSGIHQIVLAPLPAAR